MSQPDRPVKFGIIGSGWRSEFIVRIARAVPQRLAVTGIVTRTAARADEIAAAWGVAAHTSLDDLLSASAPDFVVVSVPWDASPDAIRAAVARRVPVLAETPPAPDADGLRRLWSDVGASGLVQVAEQYLLMPGHAARRAAVDHGVIGTPTSVQVSSTHLYHAVSLIRGLLGVTVEPATVDARSFTAPLADPLSPAGWACTTSPTTSGGIRCGPGGS
ncbi:MAG TPA: Gfo/Idh/MocA family oxidoreductase [Micromonosporaceae bacterium]